MAESEPNIQSFVIKIWLETELNQGHPSRWRGHITHVPSGERRYVQTPDEIIAFIVPYLRGMGIRLGITWRAKEWLSGWLRRLKPSK